MKYSRKLAATVAAVVFTIICFGTLALSAGGDHDEDGTPLDRSRVRQGFNIAPVPLDLQGKNRDLVGFGSYLVNAIGGCNDCHTNPSYAAGGDPFLGQPKQVNVAGYLAGGRSFATPTGTFISRNLTPDKTG